MPVDVTTPPPDELDSKVEQMLRHVDKVHAEVVNRLDSPTDVTPSPTATTAGTLDQQVDRALRDAAEAAKTANQPAPPPAHPVEQASPASSAGALKQDPQTVPSAAIKELDEHLSTATQDDDEFADGSSMVEGQSLDVPLPAEALIKSVAQDPPDRVALPDPVPSGATVPTAPAAPVAPAASQPVAPTTRPAPAPIPKPASKPAMTPVAIPKPDGPTLADHFWRVATPVMEPIAVRLGKLPIGFQHTVGWIGIVTLFMAATTWGYVFFFQETRPASHLYEEQQSVKAKADAESKSPGLKAESAVNTAEKREKTAH